MKRIIKDYFTFSKKERVAVIILLLLIAGFIALPYLFPSRKNKPVINAALQESIAQLRQGNVQKDADSQSQRQQPFQPSDIVAETKFVLFAFDPNTIDANGWKKLGLRDKTISTILNYRNKGGKFRQPDDIRKIWGLRKEEADRIIPYTRITAEQNQFNHYPVSTKQSSIVSSFSVIDINTATLQQFMQLPGIDHLTPYRIIRFREKLGGFVTVQQIKDTYGMTDSLYQSILPYLKIEMASVKKININAISDNELNMHPYISRDIARSIIIYRNQHGKYQKIDDVKKIVFISEETFQKIAPYITVE